MRLALRISVGAGGSRKASELLAQAAGLPKLRIKAAMQKGAVWLERDRRRPKRLRRAQAVAKPGDRLAIYYDSELLAITPPAAVCRHDAGRYSVWFKPAGLMAQGTRFGDHCSLLRQAELGFRPARPGYLIHRLDREAAGLVIIAHDRAAAGALSQLFAQRRILKRYRIEVRGQIGPQGSTGRIELPLDGRAAATDYRVVGYDAAADCSLVEAVMQTGRRHQIRRHFALAGHPVMGDPRYGQHNKNAAGLKLLAWGLEFTCPFTGQSLSFTL